MTTSRKYQGFHVPLLSRNDLLLMFDVPLNDPLYIGATSSNEWAIPLISHTLTTVSAVYSLDSGNDHTVGVGRIDRQTKSKWGISSYLSYMKKLQFQVSGQLKNFLVCVATCSAHQGPTIKVLIRGSKSSAASGIWHWVLADYLSHFFGEVDIDCYDPNEVPGTEERLTHLGQSTSRARIRHFASGYDEDAKDYDVAIDDAYVTGTVPWTPKSLVWSLKNHSAVGIPFLHEYESRIFSHDRIGIISPCPCAVCRLVASCSKSYSHFVLLKSAAIFLGGSCCNLVDYASDLASKGELFKRLCAMPVVKVLNPIDIRSTLALSNDIQLQVRGPSHISAKTFSRGEPLSIVHKEGFAGADSVASCDALVGKQVVFVGVHPSILDGTKTRRGKLGDPEVHVVTSLGEKVLRDHSPDNLWCLDQELIGYYFSGHEWRGYHYFKRRKVKMGITLSTYSISRGIDIRDDPDILWTRDVVGHYQVTEQQGEEYWLDFDGPRQDRTKMKLVYPFRTTVAGSVLDLDPYNSFVIDVPTTVKYVKPERENYVDDNVEWELLKMSFCAGVYVISKRDAFCSYSIHDGEVRTSSCLHDHVLRSGNVQINLKNSRLHDISVVENGILVQGHVVDASDEGLSGHYHEFRPGKKIVRIKGIWECI